MVDFNRFQRVGSDHNAGVGRAFEEVVRLHFARQGIALERDFAVPVGVSKVKKPHRFDLGSKEPPILLECKSHTWTAGGNMPSAKLTVWIEAMYYFHIAPPEFRKALCVSKHERKGQSLAAYYLRTHGHLIPDDVEIWEFDVDASIETRLR